MVAGAGYRVLEASDWRAALSLVSSEPHVLVLAAREAIPALLLDLAALRQATEAPILVLGDEGAVAEREALSLGADWYCSRPVSPALLLARIRSCFRRWPPAVTAPPGPRRRGGSLRPTGPPGSVERPQQPGDSLDGGEVSLR